jgi:hypothetical protein
MRLKFDEVEVRMVVLTQDKETSREGVVISKGNDSFKMLLIIGGHQTTNDADITRADVDDGVVRVFDALSI